VRLRKNQTGPTRPEQLQLGAHPVESSSNCGVVGIETFGSDSFAFVVVHAVLDAGRRCQVPDGSFQQSLLLAPLINEMS
jgi:hypothetical protein